MKNMKDDVQYRLIETMVKLWKTKNYNQLRFKRFIDNLLVTDKDKVLDASYMADEALLEFLEAKYQKVIALEK